MTETKHTPGPWEAVITVCGFWNVREPGGISGGRGVATIGFQKIDRSWVIDDVDEANARLIAAAPELLAALVDCIPDLERFVSTQGPGPDRRLEVARAAIARATGK